MMTPRSLHILVTIFVILVTCLAISAFWHKHNYKSIAETSDSVMYYRLQDFLQYSKGSLKVFPAFEDAFKEANEVLIKAANYQHATFIMFEHQNNIDEVMKQLKVPPNVKAIYGVQNSDYIASKSLLTLTIRSGLPAEVVESILPKSYITSIPEDMRQFKEDASSTHDTVYIMKKNIQRQEGHYITNDVNYIVQHANEYVVIQEMLQDPLLISGHKVNMRIYLLVVIAPDDTHAQFYSYKDGFMYYTPSRFIRNSLNTKNVITTGYIDRAIYETNPLTHSDLSKYLGIEKYNILSKNIGFALKSLKQVYSTMFASENRHLPGTKFSIYGVDIAPDNDLGCKIMEVNKGPDLSYKDERDRHVKLNMVHDALQIAGLFGDKVGTKIGGFRKL